MSMQLDNPFELGSLYLLSECIGRGATGAVYRGVNKTTGAPIAAKVLHSHHTEDPEVVAQFLQEKSLLMSLNHESIVRVFDLVAESNTLAIITELVDGYSLRRYLEANNNLPPYYAALIASRILGALVHAHEVGVIHRDVKPDNILLTHTWQSGQGSSIKLTDFGISCFLKGQVDAVSPVGTPAYMPPELWTQRVYSQSGDVYETGVTLYEMLAGRSPFPDDNAGHHHAYSSVQRLDVPESLWGMLSGMLAKNPEHRPSAAQAFAQINDLLPELTDLAPLAPVVQPENYNPATVIRNRTTDNMGAAKTGGKVTSGRKTGRKTGGKKTAEILDNAALSVLPPSVFQVSEFNQGGPQTQLYGVPRRALYAPEGLGDGSEEKSTKKRVLFVVAATLAGLLFIGGAIFAGLHFFGKDSAEALDEKTSEVNKEQKGFSVEPSEEASGGGAGINIDSLVEGLSKEKTDEGADASGSAANPGTGGSGSTNNSSNNQGSANQSNTNTQNTNTTAKPPATITIYHFYNEKLGGAHVYTGDPNEIKELPKNGWVKHDDTWKVPATGSVRIYRMYKGSDHIFVTKDQGDAKLKDGWKYDGEKSSFYSASAGSGVPVYEFFNPGLNRHCYTAGEGGIATLTQNGWKKNEGVKFYVMK